MNYRAEIDGLRALAVVPVILFHAGFELFSGGFVGVDVFFVISGYLITTILIEDIENERFSIVNFYERRARRILPALFFVMLICIPFAWMWMLPSQMKDFSQSLVAVSLFASNILFWTESGYFDAAAEEKPLLHTWSLAVEEQFYVLFPIFLIFAWRFGRNKVFWTIIIMSAISLLLSEWGWRNNATANFYLAHTRAWELFSGSIAAFIVQQHGVQKNNLLATLGLAAIIFSIFVFDESTPFPSLYALVPVLGVVLLVLYGAKETFVAKILSTKGFVSIGLISYSAYLWHQPLFAFSRIKLLDNPSVFLMLGLCLFSILLAFLSWRFVENPLRNNNMFSRKMIFSGSLLGVLLSLALGYVGHIKNGFVDRFDYTTIDLVGMEPDKPKIEETIGCTDKDVDNLNSIFCNVVFNEKPSEIAVFGDSHADVIAMALHHAKVNFVVASLGGCAPLIGVGVAEGNWGKGVCKNLSAMQLEYIKQHPEIKKILLVARWSLYTSGDYETSMQKWFLYGEENVSHTQESSRKIFSEKLEETILAYQDLGLSVSVLMQVPQQKYKPVEAITKTFLIGNKSNKTILTTRLKEHLDLQEYNRDIIEKIKAKNGSFAVISLDDMFCNDEVCRMLDDKTVLYRDDDHLSLAGAQYISSRLVSYLMNK